MRYVIKMLHLLNFILIRNKERDELQIYENIGDV